MTVSVAGFFLSVIVAAGLMSIALLPEYIGAPSVGGRLSAVTGAERVTLGRLPSCGFLLLCFRLVPMPSAYGADAVGIAPFRLWGAVFWRI